MVPTLSHKKGESLAKAIFHTEAQRHGGVINKDNPDNRGNITIFNF